VVQVEVAQVARAGGLKLATLSLEGCFGPSGSSPFCLTHKGVLPTELLPLGTCAVPGESVGGAEPTLPLFVLLPTSRAQKVRERLRNLTA
jgi:hypothetical protein